MKQSVTIASELQRERFLSHWSKVEIPKQGWHVEWEEYQYRRTSEQNNLLWVSAYRPIAEYMSQKSGKIITAEMIHAICKDKFLKPLTVEYMGKSKRYSGSTTKLNKADFSEYLEQVYEFGAAMGVWFEG